ncbi:MAG: hypothetical protein U1F87_14985 [Kiritimatiellia bacterium]
MADGGTLLEAAAARRLLTRGPARCNLLEAAEAAPEVARALGRRNRRAIAWVAAAGAALLALSAAWLVNAARMTRDLQGRIDRTFTAITGQPNTQPGNEVLVAERLVTGESNRPFERAFAPGAELLLRELLHAGLSQAAAFERIEWKDGRLTARGTLPGPEAGARIREALEPFGLRCEVRVGAQIQPGRLVADITAVSATEGEP